MVQENGLYLVLGGDLKSLEKNEFKEDSNIDIVGIFKNYDEAKAMWSLALSPRKIETGPT